ncbi:MAG: TraR/DksA C4-type zinc finger protein [Flavimaricola sp.]|nr:TraR/DksA C4-type zinc finger protein [Flavimaricola sp.]
MTNIAERRHQLTTRRAELLSRAEAIEAELVSHDTKDWDDLATEREADEVLEGMEMSAAQEIAQIDAALIRMDAGEYGACVKCGEEIAEARLDLLPATPLCRACAT